MSTVLAKVEDGSLYSDLVNAGYTSDFTIKCPNCKETYRVFYAQKPKNVTLQAAGVPALDDVVEQSHPEHPSRIRLP